MGEEVLTAVVHGQPNVSVTFTLLDGRKGYTLASQTGQGNFKVGSNNVGENTPGKDHRSNLKRTKNWLDREAPCRSGTGMHTDAFANSLRKYPSTSPNRSSEIVERLVSFSQIKNSGSYKTNSPIRNNSPRIGHKSRRINDESPTRDAPRRKISNVRNSYNYTSILRNNDRKLPREISKRDEDIMNNADSEHDMAHVETQASIELASKETVIFKCPESTHRSVITRGVSPANSDIEYKICEDTSTVCDHTVQIESLEDVPVKLLSRLESKNSNIGDTIDVHETYTSPQSTRSSEYTTIKELGSIPTVSQSTFGRRRERKRGCCYCNNRTTKMQNSKNCRGRYNERQLRELNYTEMRRKWLDKKLQKLSRYFNTPGGEEKLKEKIEINLLEAFDFSADCNEKSKKVVEQLTTDIIEKLKNSLRKINHDNRKPIKKYKENVSRNKRTKMNRGTCVKNKRRVNRKRSFKTSSLLLHRKYISDTYVALRDTSHNKSVLTRNKIDKMNLKTKGKLTPKKYDHITIDLILQRSKCVNDPQLDFYRYQKIAKKPETHIKKNNLNVYEMRLFNLPKHENVTYNETDYVSYFHQIEEKVDLWLSSLAMDSLEKSALSYQKLLKGLTKDIVNRFKFLELNLSACRSYNNETEFLKFCIFKRMQKLIGYKSIEISQKASELLKMIENIHVTSSHIPDTSLNSKKSTNSSSKHANTIPTSCNCEAGSIIKQLYSETTVCLETEHTSAPGESPPTPINEDKVNTSDDPMKTNNKLGKINIIMTSTSHANNDEIPNRKNLNANQNKNKSIQRKTSSQKSKSDTLMLRNNKDEPPKSDKLEDFPQNMSEQEICDCFVGVFRKHCQELPILATTPELTEIARQAILNNIIKIFFTLKEDTDVENDYTYFEFALEEQIDGLLDLLPQTPDMLKIRDSWKVKIVMDARKMLKCIHKITGNPALIDPCNQDINRPKLRENYKIYNDEAQQLHMIRAAEHYLISSNYNEQDTLKRKIYMHRLLSRADNICEYMKRNVGKDFLHLPMDVMNVIIIKELGLVPVPEDDILPEEIELVQLSDEIEVWYDGLPLRSAKGCGTINREAILHTLVKKIHDIETNMELNNSSVETDIRHEVSKFLSNKNTEIEKDKGMDVNLMVEELINRLQNMRREKSLNYDSFEEQIPLSSTNAQPNIDPAYKGYNEESYMNSQSNGHADQHNNFKEQNFMGPSRNTLNRVVETNQIAGSSCRGIPPSYHNSIKNSPRTVSQYSNDQSGTQKPLDYESFVNDLPISSTFRQADPNSFQRNHGEQYNMERSINYERKYQPQNFMELPRNKGVLRQSQVAGPSSQVLPPSHYTSIINSPRTVSQYSSGYTCTQNPLGYESFVNELPFSSTFTQPGLHSASLQTDYGEQYNVEKSMHFEQQCEPQNVNGILKPFPPTISGNYGTPSYQTLRRSSPHTISHYQCEPSTAREYKVREPSVQFSTDMDPPKSFRDPNVKGSYMSPSHRKCCCPRVIRNAYDASFDKVSLNKDHSGGARQIHEPYIIVDKVRTERSPSLKGQRAASVAQVSKLRFPANEIGLNGPIFEGSGEKEYLRMKCRCTDRHSPRRQNTCYCKNGTSRHYCPDSYPYHDHF